MQEAGVKIMFNTEVTPASVKEFRPDAVVVSTGAHPAPLNVPGADGSNVVQAVDVITRKAKVGKEVVVVGGRYVGMEVALDLAKQGNRVSLVTRHELGRNVEYNIFMALRQRLIEQGVYLYPNCGVAEINKKGVNVISNHTLVAIKEKIK